MAAADYYSCDRCGHKAFYDANVDWGSSYLKVDEFGTPLSVTMLCETCFETHAIVVRARREPAAVPAWVEPLASEWEREAKEALTSESIPHPSARRAVQYALEACAAELRERAKEGR